MCTHASFFKTLLVLWSHPKTFLAFEKQNVSWDVRIKTAACRHTLIFCVFIFTNPFWAAIINTNMINPFFPLRTQSSDELYTFQSSIKRHELAEKSIWKYQQNSNGKYWLLGVGNWNWARKHTHIIKKSHCSFYRV